MKTEFDVCLAEHNTLGVPSVAPYYMALHRDADVLEAVAWAQLNRAPVLVLGGGSNVLLPPRPESLVLHIKTRGIHPILSNNSVHLRVAAGENWDALVRYCLGKGWYGIENLISIPGLVGAAPIQNIGAYGVELSSVLEGVTGYDLGLSAWRYLSKPEMALAYRDSIFKRELKDSFIITQVVLNLSTEAKPTLGYAALDEAVESAKTERGLADITPELVAEVISELRASKLPDPAMVPNVGSFFKNPVVSAEHHAKLLANFPALPSWPHGEGFKLPAAWLIDQAGWRGYEKNGVGVHSKQALVLINPGQGSASRVIALAKEIAADISAKYNVELEVEPRIY